ncbi:sel1 repeat family protein, partial [Venenivibrio stagnispumantis]|nr:sel1 repeat family protein [Venenivibrio stagnispumantis]
QEGCYNLGEMYYYGKGVEQDYVKAAGLFEKACDAGIAKGCNNLGRMYYDGEGVEEDYVKAAVFFKKACDAGSAKGCYLYKSLIYMKIVDSLLN